MQSKTPIESDFKKWMRSAQIYTIIQPKYHVSRGRNPKISRTKFRPRGWFWSANPLTLTIALDLLNESYRFVHCVRVLGCRFYQKFIKIQFKSTILKQKIAEISFKMTKFWRNSMKIVSKLHRIYVKRSKNDDLPSNICFEADFNHKNH